MEATPVANNARGHLLAKLTPPANKLHRVWGLKKKKPSSQPLQVSQQ